MVFRNNDVRNVSGIESFQNNPIVVVSKNNSRDSDLSKLYKCIELSQGFCVELPSEESK